MYLNINHEWINFTYKLQKLFATNLRYIGQPQIHTWFAKYYMIMKNILEIGKYIVHINLKFFQKY